MQQLEAASLGIHPSIRTDEGRCGRTRSCGGGGLGGLGGGGQGGGGGGWGRIGGSRDPSFRQDPVQVVLSPELRY